MNQEWRIILMLIWLLMLWTAESIIPLKANNRKHFLINAVFTLSTVVINALLIVVLAEVIAFCHSKGVGLFNVAQLPFFVQVAVGLLILDLTAAYLSHRIMHRFDLFWRFHRVHHLDEMVDVTTGLRQHPLETFLRFAFLIAGVIVLGTPLSVVVIYQTVSLTNALLEHANISMNSKVDRILSTIFITPNFHKIHHSFDQSDADRNYGNIFSIWDTIFGTRKNVADIKKLSYGLDYKLQAKQTLTELIFLPFKRIKTQK
jgi:sterol desaturase/sphingolipid hydroxylase (fatty acid hydroxylase superfamily)